MNKKKKIYLIKAKKFVYKFNRKKTVIKYLHLFLILFISGFLIILPFCYIFKRSKIIKIRENHITKEYNATKYAHLRKQMFKILSKVSKKNITSLNDVYFLCYYKLGNLLIAINKVIFYCEILQCRRIILNKNIIKIFKDVIYDKNYDLVIEPETNAKNFNSRSAFHWPHPYYTVLGVNPENRFDVFKEEILNNIPKAVLDENDLYIHIRNGDVYKNPNLGIFYAQPPLCFYEKAIEFKKFKTVYIIAKSDDYPIIRKLISEYKNVKYNKSSLINDMSKLVYGYNIVGSISSFLTSLIKLNDNLQYFWEYDIYHKVTKINHLHYSISNFTRKYTIYKMLPSPIYKETLYFWKRTKEQLDLMMNVTCPNNFIIIKPNI